MSPIIERNGRFHFDVIERNKLYLMWLSCNDFNMLDRSQNKAILMDVWANIKSDLQQCFDNYRISLQSIINTFKQMTLTIDPCLPCGYDPEKDMLIFNLWSLFFSLSHDGFAVPPPTWQTGSELVHEFDHDQFFKKLDMIQKTEKDYKEFEKEHLGELEKRALSAQRDFLENSKNNVPAIALTYKLKIRKWSPDGKVLNSETPVIKIPKENVIESINDMILQISEVINKIEAGGSYDIMSSRNSTEINSKIADILSLPINLDKEKKDYPKLEIKM